MIKSSHFIRQLVATVWFGFAWGSISAANEPVQIHEDLPWIDVDHFGQTIRLQRIQENQNKLTGVHTLTSRPCPPMCPSRMQIAKGVTPVAELEVVDFLDQQVKEGNGLLIDARMPEWYEADTIPGSVNLPFVVFNPENQYRDELIKTLGAVKDPETQQWDFSQALELLLYCNGPTCKQSPTAIENLIEIGYPSSKLYYYRGGMQSWQLMGFTTVANHLKTTEASGN